MFKITNSRYKALRQGDPDFTFSPDGITLVHRAGFDISQNCPKEYRMIILECMNNDWIKPVAYMRDTEYTMELLRK
jgi:hypothetical protein